MLIGSWMDTSLNKLFFQIKIWKGLPGHEVVIIHCVETSTCPCGMGYEVWSYGVLEHNEGANCWNCQERQGSKNQSGLERCHCGKQSWQDVAMLGGPPKIIQALTAKREGKGGAHGFGTLNYVFSVTYYSKLWKAILFTIYLILLPRKVKLVVWTL